MNNLSEGLDVSHSKGIVSVIIPVYNEARILKELNQGVLKALRSSGYRHEIIFVNDGSNDDTAQVLDYISRTAMNVKVLHLSRNFGHQAAVHAGITHAIGDALIVMDADLQDDPQKIPLFLKKWQEGYDVVFAVRTERKENVIKRLLFKVFYRILNIVSQMSIPMDAGNYSLMTRRVVEEVLRLSDHDRYLPGLRNWVGFRQTGIEIERGQRYDAHPRVSMRDLWRLAKTAIFSFSSLPLTIFYGIAFVSLIVFLGLSCFTFYHKFLTGHAIPGWTSFLMVTSFFGTINALGIGILGEYVLRIYNQVRARPLFIVERKVNFSDDRQ